MNKIIIIFVITVIIAGAVTIPSLTEEFADAGSRKKVHFTQTITSSQDPGQGHRNHELALILSPNIGTLYDGSLTYTASEPVQIVVLHEITKNDSKGQSTWTVDGDTVYGLSLIDPKTKAGSFEFTGAALALHTSTTKEFTATVSVDGWIRGQPIDVMQTNSLEKQKAPLELLRANVSATIPMHNGTFNGDSVVYIITDSNDQEYADMLSKKQDWKVEFAPPLSETPNDVLGPVYIFTNGLSGDGINGYQNDLDLDLEMK